ncbi:MAG: hypothetical protein ABIW81_01610 [Terrimesophilobacter sp.]
MRARLAASAALLALVLGGTTGCTFITAQATTNHYDPSDGIGTTIGEIQVRNAMLLTGDGTTASLLINLANDSKVGVDVKLQYENADKTKVNGSVYVNAGDVTSIGAADAKKFVLSGIDAPAGSLFPVYIQYDDVTGKQLWIPVLDNREAQYADLLPSSTPTP